MWAVSSSKFQFNPESQTKGRAATSSNDQMLSVSYFVLVKSNEKTGVLLMALTGVLDKKNLLWLAAFSPSYLDICLAWQIVYQ